MTHSLGTTLAALAGDPIVDGPLRLQSSVAGPASEEEIQAAWANSAVPAAVALWRAARSAELFRDIDYGQWGLRVLDPRTSRERTDAERQQRPSDFEAGDVIVGEFLGDLELLVIDRAGSVLVAQPLDPRRDWYTAAADMGSFLEAYRESKGDKYWERRLT